MQQFARVKIVLDRVVLVLAIAAMAILFFGGACVMFGGEVGQDVVGNFLAMLQGHHFTSGKMPVLSLDERETVRRLAFADARIQKLLAGKPYATSVVPDWSMNPHDPKGADLAGALIIYFDEEHRLAYEWPQEARYGRYGDQTRPETTEYSEAEARGLGIKVNVEEERVIAIWPLTAVQLLQGHHGGWPGSRWPPGFGSNEGYLVRTLGEWQDLSTVPWPELSEEEKARAVTIALQDSRVKKLVQDVEVAAEVVAGLNAPAAGQAPALPFAEAQVRFRLAEIVHLDEYEWTNYPENQPPTAETRQPLRDIDRSVYEFGVRVSLQEERVVQITPWVPPIPHAYYVLADGNAVPVLTSGEQARAVEIALADPRTRAVVAGAPFVLGPVRDYYYHPGGLGAVVTLHFDGYRHVAYTWPYANDYGQEEGTWFLSTESLPASSASVLPGTDRISIKVNLQDGKVVAMKPFQYW